MNKEEFKKKVSLQWGALSAEHRMARDLVQKAEKWDNYQYEKFGPPSANKKENNSRAIPPRQTNCAADDRSRQRQQQRESFLPNDREIFRVTWSYLFARAGWIFMAYVMMFGFLGILFLGMYMAVK